MSLKVRYIYPVFYEIFCKKLYSWVISQNVDKDTSVTIWRSEWQTENVSNVNKFTIETFFTTQIKL